MRSALLELLEHTSEIGIAGAKAPCEPVPTPLGNPLSISDNLELTGLPGCSDASISRRSLMRVTRLVTLALLLFHVGQ